MKWRLLLKVETMVGGLSRVLDRAATSPSKISIKFDAFRLLKQTATGAEDNCLFSGFYVVPGIDHPSNRGGLRYPIRDDFVSTIRAEPSSTLDFPPKEHSGTRTERLVGILPETS